MKIKFIKPACDKFDHSKKFELNKPYTLEKSRAESAIKKGIAVEVKKSTQEKLSEKTTKK